MSDQWIPMGFDLATYDVLHEGIPPWLEGPLRLWMQTVENRVVSDHYGRSRIALARLIDTRMRLQKPIVNSLGGSSISTIVVSRGDEFSLIFIDLLLWHLSPPSDYADALRILLGQAGSAWTTSSASGRYRLTKRVPEATVKTVESIVRAGSDAGALLGEAWQATFGVPPNPEESYEKSIKSVEAAGAHLVEPKNSNATLGTMIATMKSQGGWSLPMTDKTGAHFDEAILRIAEALWKGQPSRHGNNGYRQPTQDEAEAAFVAALSLVQWFESGVLTKRHPNAPAQTVV